MPFNRSYASKRGLVRGQRRVQDVHLHNEPAPTACTTRRTRTNPQRDHDRDHGALPLHARRRLPAERVGEAVLPGNVRGKCYVDIIASAADDIIATAAGNGECGLFSWFRRHIYVYAPPLG